MAEEGPMAQISLAGSEVALKGGGRGGEGRVGGGVREKHEGKGGRRGEEHKDRGRQTVKQRSETRCAPSRVCRWGSSPSWKHTSVGSTGV